jgi:rod shape-determining protein MreC
VLIPERVTQGIGNVWGATVNADSATRRIAAAGDSIAKQAAVLEARARLAALDSVKRVTIDSVRRSLGAPTTPLTAADSAAMRAQGVPMPAQSTPAPVVRDTTRVRRVPAAATPVPRRDSTRPDTTRPPRQ